MRALTNDEHAMLRGDYIGPLHDEADSLNEVAESLILRGCLVRYQSAPGEWGHNITALGRLALRVARPEMGLTFLP